jgi:hypothetical protein
MIRLGMAGALALILTGCGSEPAADSSNPSAAEAAAAGVAAVVKSEAAGRPFPDDMPAFVEPMPGGSYLTGMRGSNAVRSTGMDMYDAPGTAAEAVAFHTDALTRGGFAPVVGAPQKVRDTMETSITGKHADGRTLDVVVIEQESGDAVVQMRYTIPAAQ